MKSASFISTDDRVLVKVDEEGKVAGLDVMSTMGPQTGVAVSVGANNRSNTFIPVGSKVFFGKMAGTEVVLEDGEFRSFRVEEILGFE